MHQPQTVVITGAGGGLGLEILRLVLGKSDVKLVFTYSTKPEEYFLGEDIFRQSILSGKLHHRQMDFSQPFNTIEDFVPPQLKHSRPTPMIIINNAGLLQLNKPGEIDIDSARLMFEVNFWAAVKLTYALIPYIQSGSHIVNIGSMGGVQGSSKFPGLSFYSASKGALAIWSESLASELAGSRIAVNCLALGSVETKMLQQAFPGYIASNTAAEMAEFIVHFAFQAHQIISGKTLPVARTTP